MKSAAILASQAERGCALIPKKHWMGTSVSHPVLFLALYNINCDFIRMRIKNARVLRYAPTISGISARVS